MVFGPLIGAGAGAVAGLALGAAVFSGDRPRDLTFVTEAADRNDDIRTPAVTNVNDKMRALMPLTPEWTFWPDYDRWVMINRVVRLMWPNLTGAILDEIIKAIKPMVQGIMADLPLPEGVIEDIQVGGTSLLDADHRDPHFAGKLFTMGDIPTRVAGAKVYTTNEDNCVMEMPMMWGSNSTFDLQVYLRLGPLRLVVPMQVSDVQFKLLVRLTMLLVDTLPCIGGATVTLLESPHTDFKLKVLGGFDMMAVPGIRDAVQFGVKYVMKEILLYPNSVTVPLMTDFGALPAPKGMLLVRLDRIDGFKTNDLIGKGDPYVEFSVRASRTHTSKVVKYTKAAVFNQEFYMVVDDLKDQMLTIKVWDSDLGPNDELVGVMQLYFTTEEIQEDAQTGGQRLVYTPRPCIATPMSEEPLQLPITAPPGPVLAKLGVLGQVVGGAVDAVGAAAATVGSIVGLGQEVEAVEPQKAKIQVAKRFAEVRAQEEAAAGATAIAWRSTVINEDGSCWEELTEPAARTAAIKQMMKEEAEAEAKCLAKLPKKERAQALQDKAARQKAEDDKIVLVEEEVTLRGNVTPAEADVKRAEARGAKIKSRGTVSLSLTFMPFNQPEYDDDIEMKPVKGGLAAYVPFDPPPPREIAANVSDFQKGLLTVKVIQAKGISSGGGLLANTNPFVELLLVDCDKLRRDERKVTRTVYNDRDPRWGDQLDFVMVSAGSMLTVNVWDKTTAVEAVTSLSLSKARLQDRHAGRVVIPVVDVVRNGSLKDVFPLQDAESGTIEMKLTWSNCYIDDYVD